MIISGTMKIISMEWLPALANILTPVGERCSGT